MSGKVREGLHSGCWRAETLFSMRWQSVLREFPERPRRRPKWTRKLKGVVSVNWRDYVGDDWYQEGTDPSELSSVPRAMRQGRAGRQEERVGRTNMDVQREGLQAVLQDLVQCSVDSATELHSPAVATLALRLPFGRSRIARQSREFKEFPQFSCSLTARDTQRPSQAVFHT